ncbi:hypothetical protein OIU74_020437 [Salix koriyanagi]|uniref:Uncharacterized protein n=1 Tax=Salix koriyanagi TaxID=2511006 RepID=A0A9Q0P655_9ROSI|nr:hypothetical protein OIU74_020437 [Salix koriyanagi]
MYISHSCNFFTLISCILLIPIKLGNNCLRKANILIWYLHVLFLMLSVATVNPDVLLELFSVYRDWQEAKVQQISKKQEDIESKIEVADALAIKLLQRFNDSVSAMKTTSQNLSEVHSLQVEIGELKGRLTDVISNCDALCNRITTEGPESLRSSVKPFSTATADSDQL